MEKKWCNGHNKILYMYESGCTTTLRGLKSIIFSMFYTSFYIALFNYIQNKQSTYYYIRIIPKSKFFVEFIGGGQISATFTQPLTKFSMTSTLNVHIIVFNKVSEIVKTIAAVNFHLNIIPMQYNSRADYGNTFLTSSFPRLL